MRATNSSYGDYDNLVLNGNYDEMVNTVWAFACVGWKHHQIFRELESSIAVHLRNFNESEKSQLYHVAFYVQKMQWPDVDLSVWASLLESFRCAHGRLESRPSQL